MLVRMVSSLTLVVALMLVLAAVAKRMLGSRLPVQSGTAVVQVVGSGYLGPRKTVSLVSVAGELLIIGTTQNDIVPLGRLSDTEQIKRVLASGPGHGGVADGFFWSQWWRGSAISAAQDRGIPSPSPKDAQPQGEEDHASR